MKTFAWLVGGFMLLGLSGMIEAVGDTGASPAERVPLYLVALAVLLGAPYCFYKAIRSGFAGMGRSKPAPSAPAAPERPRAAHRIVDPPETADAAEFDPDIAFARYMDKRTSQPAEAQAGEPESPSPQPPRPSFGRKVV